MTKTSEETIIAAARNLKFFIRDLEDAIQIKTKDIQNMGERVESYNSQLADILQDLGEEVAKREGLI